MGLSAVLSLAAAALLSAREDLTARGVFRQEGNQPANNSSSNSSSLPPSELPFLLEDGEDQEKRAALEPAQPRWVRVMSSLAMHPAMYVPGDGMVYCPIAKASAVRDR